VSKERFSRNIERLRETAGRLVEDGRYREAESYYLKALQLASTENEPDELE
jgi:hypothetical protein